MESNTQKEVVDRWKVPHSTRIERPSPELLVRRFIGVSLAAGMVTAIAIALVFNGTISQPAASIIVAIISGACSVISALINARKLG